MLVVNFNHNVFLLVGIGLCTVLFVRGIAGNAEILGKVNYSISYYTDHNWNLDIPEEARIEYPEELQLEIQVLRLLQNVKYRIYTSWFLKLTCWFTFQCTIGCQCNLAANNITITCPDGLSTVEVKYPTSRWSASDYWSSSFLRSSSSLVSPPRRSPKNMITIYFWYNANLNIITQGAFKPLENISECYLIISENQIEYIRARQFEGLSKLHGLFLDNNKIASLDQNAFKGLDSLVSLYLHRNKIAEILPNQFQELTNLKNLCIDHNNISVIGQQDFHGLGNLTALNIAYNSIVEIHSRRFQDLTHLLELYLGHNMISKIHPMQIPNLIKLYLDHNTISEIHPRQFQNLSRLQYVNLGNNVISVIHPMQLKNLTKLYLDHNTIPEIHPHHFENLSHLQYLSLGHNLISEIHPQQFQNLTSLYELYLDHNTISEIHPRLFQNLTSLYELYLDHNTISKIQPQQFQDLISLNGLYLSHNMISEIHPRLFQNLSSLWYLHLNHNRISRIHPMQFQNLITLSRLRLDYNNIGMIHSNQFQNLGNYLYFELNYAHNNISEIPLHLVPFYNRLFKLNLNHNRISTITQQVFQNLTELRYIFLECNRISRIHPQLFHIRFNQLYWLQLDHNDITDIHPNQFEFVYGLYYLDLSHNNLVNFALASNVSLIFLRYLSLSNNKLGVLPYTVFQDTLSLIYLDLSRNRINMVNAMILNANNSRNLIDIIDLRQNNLYSLNTDSFSSFPFLTVVLVDNEATCCFITGVICSATIPRSQFLTCGRLLPNLSQRVIMWIVGLFALLSNLGVLLYRYRSKEKGNKVQLLLISNLSISDFIMGVYMVIISSADLYYKQMFPSELWRLSFVCKFAGTLSVLSSEASVLFVTLISLDRFLGIKFPFSTYRIGGRRSRILSLVLWLIALTISILSTILSSISPDWYDVSEVCTGLPLSRKNVNEKRFREYGLGIRDQNGEERFINSSYSVVTGHQPDMYFGIAIFTALNSICFIVICVCYSGIFLTTIKNSKASWAGP